MPGWPGCAPRRPARSRAPRTGRPVTSHSAWHLLWETGSCPPVPGLPVRVWPALSRSGDSRQPHFQGGYELLRLRRPVLPPPAQDFGDRVFHRVRPQPDSHRDPRGQKTKLPWITSPRLQGVLGATSSICYPDKCLCLYGTRRPEQSSSLL